MPTVTVFADVSCPFAHVGLTRIATLLDGLVDAPGLIVRSWPLEVVNGSPLTGPALVPKVEALRRDVAPDLFGGFDPDRFPATTIPALAGERAAYRHGHVPGLAFSRAVRRLLFEEGNDDVADPAVIDRLLATHGLSPVEDRDVEAVQIDHRDGVALGVRGSPHFFTTTGDFFCPTLDIRHDDAGYEIAFDADGFTQFVEAALAQP